MTYASLDDYSSAYGNDELLQLTDRAGTGDIDSSIYDASAIQADSEINGYLSGRFSLPLSSTDKEISRLALIITRHHLYTTGRPDFIQKDYDQALLRLSDIRDGKFTISADPAGSGNTVMEVFYTGGERVFTRGFL